MTDLRSITAPVPLAQPTETPKSANAITSDFDTFLTLLTAQIKNQDPLEPMKSEEFAVQLATFSGVEQQVQTNQLLETLLVKSAGDEFSQMAGWIGNEVRAKMPVFLDGGAVTIDPEAPLAGTRHQIVVRDIGGAEVHRLASDDLGSAIEWNGAHAGGAVPPGIYSFTVESFEGTNLVATEPAAAYGTISEVRSGADGPVFILRGGIEIGADAVTAVRDPT